MRYRLSTLLVAITAIALMAAVLGGIRRARQPVPIINDANGKRAIAFLSAAKTVEIELHSLSNKVRVQLTPKAKRELVTWLSAGVRDNKPAKYVGLGEITFGDIKFEPPSDPFWGIMDISDFELGIRVHDGGYWRGLNRKQFEELVHREVEATNTKQTAND